MNLNLTSKIETIASSFQFKICFEFYIQLCKFKEMVFIKRLFHDNTLKGRYQEEHNTTNLSLYSSKMQSMRLLTRS